MSEERIAARARKEAERLRRAAARHQRSLENARAGASEMDAFAIETERKMRREQIKEVNKMSEPVQTVVPPHIGWKLVVRRKFSTGSAIYDVGVTISDVADLGANARALVNARFLEWLPASAGTDARKPRALPAPAPEKPRPAVVVVDDGTDAVASWRKTLATHTAKLNGNSQLARDILMNDAMASALYLRAVRVWTTEKRQHQNLIFSAAPSSQEL